MHPQGVAPTLLRVLPFAHGRQSQRVQLFRLDVATLLLLLERVELHLFLQSYQKVLHASLTRPNETPDPLFYCYFNKRTVLVSVEQTDQRVDPSRDEVTSVRRDRHYWNVVVVFLKGGPAGDLHVYVQEETGEVLVVAAQHQEGLLGGVAQVDVARPTTICRREGVVDGGEYLHVLQDVAVSFLGEGQQHLPGRVTAQHQLVDLTLHLHPHTRLLLEYGAVGAHFHLNYLLSQGQVEAVMQQRGAEQVVLVASQFLRAAEGAERDLLVAEPSERHYNNK